MRWWCSPRPWRTNTTTGSIKTGEHHRRCGVSWIFRKHSLLSRQEMRRRFCRPGTWKIVHDESSMPSTWANAVESRVPA